MSTSSRRISASIDIASMPNFAACAAAASGRRSAQARNAMPRNIGMFCM